MSHLGDEHQSFDSHKGDLGSNTKVVAQEVYLEKYFRYFRQILQLKISGEDFYA